MQKIVKCNKCASHLIYLSIDDSPDITKLSIVCHCGSTSIETVKGTTKIAPAEDIIIEFEDTGEIICQKV